MTAISGVDHPISTSAKHCKTPSGACVIPDNFSLHAVPVITAKSGNLAAVDWAVARSGGNNNQIDITSVTGDHLNADTAVWFTINPSITSNPSIGGCNVANTGTSTDTCFIRVTSWNVADFSGNSIDEALASFTVIASVQVTARVDPTFSFVVAPVNALAVHNAITASVTSTFATLPFGNLTAGTPKYAGHQLNVTTNTQGGYTVTTVMSAQMTGVFTQDNIDPFTAAWTAPAAWAHPNGSTPNDNTGWFGANTTDADVANWSGDTTGKFGGVGSVTPVLVMTKNAADDGTQAVFVTYAIEANVFQPADTYTGTLVYNALPTY